MSAKLPSAESADDILGADDLEIVPVEVKEWNRTVHLRVLSAGEGIALGELLTGARTDGMVVIVASCLVNSKGAPLFTGDEVQKLKAKSLAVMTRLQNIAIKMNNLQPGAEAVVKNASSGAAPAASPTA